MTRAFLPHFWLLSLLLLTACGSSVGVTGRWRDPSLQRGFSNVLVVGVAKRGLYRRLYEDEFVRKFAARGVQAQPSYLLVNSDEPTREELESAIEGKGFDAVVVTHLVDIQQRREHHEGPSTAKPFITGYGYGYYSNPHYAPYYGGGFGSYYTAVYGYTHMEGYYQTTKTYNLETAIYALPEAKLVWAVITETVDPENVSDTIHTLADVIFAELANDKLL